MPGIFGFSSFHNPMREIVDNVRIEKKNKGCSFRPVNYISWIE